MRTPTTGRGRSRAGSRSPSPRRTSSISGFAWPSSRSVESRRIHRPIRRAFARGTGSSRSTARTISTRCVYRRVCYQSAGKPMSFEVERVSADGSTTRQTLSVTPDDTPPWTEMPAASERAGRSRSWPLLSGAATHHARYPRFASGQSGVEGRRPDQLDDDCSTPPRRDLPHQEQQNRPGAEA